MVVVLPRQRRQKDEGLGGRQGPCSNLEEQSRLGIDWVPSAGFGLASAQLCGCVFDLVVEAPTGLGHYSSLHHNWQLAVCWCAACLPLSLLGAKRSCSELAARRRRQP